MGAIMTQYSVATLPICSLNINKFVANTPKSLTVSFISSSFQDDVYGSTHLFQWSVSHFYEFIFIKFLFVFSAHLYMAPRSFCMNSLSSFVYIFLFILVLSKNTKFESSA